MYLTELRRIPAQTVDCSQVFEKWLAPKATKDTKQKHKKLGLKHN